jgi:polyhydroxyalkanoate synthesis regulator phasin
MMVNEIRRFMEAALGKLSPGKARELATSLVHGQGAEQVTKVAQDLMEWSGRNRKRLTELVRSEVRSQLKQVGIASRDEVDALRRRVRELEKAQGRPTTAKRSTAARRTTAPRVKRPAPAPAAATTA